MPKPTAHRVNDPRITLKPGRAPRGYGTSVSEIVHSIALEAGRMSGWPGRSRER
jgi:hypothetical protein